MPSTLLKLDSQLKNQSSISNTSLLNIKALQSTIYKKDLKSGSTVITVSNLEIQWTINKPEVTQWNNSFWNFSLIYMKKEWNE